MSNADEAVTAYRELLADPSLAIEMGRRARERLLEEHTFLARARQLIDLLGLDPMRATP